MMDRGDTENMSSEFVQPADKIIAEIKARLTSKNPNIGKTQSVVLKNGPKAFKIAIVYKILNALTKKHHHTVLSIQTWNHKKKENIFEEKDKLNITLDNEKGDEIGILRDSIIAFENKVTEEPNVYTLLKKSDYEELEKILHNPKYSQDIIRELLEEEESFNELITQGGLALFKSLSNWVLRTEDPEAVVDVLQNIESDALKNLNVLAGIAQLRKVLVVWQNNTDNGNEEFWQQTLSEFSWVISQVFSYPIFLFQKKAYVGGKAVSNEGGNLVDFLFRNNMTDNIVLVEIKTPTAKLLSAKYRQTYSMSSELSGALNQVLNYRKHIQQEYFSLQRNSASDFIAISPRCLVIIGNTDDELKDIDQIEAFEFSRSNSKDVEIISFNELFYKIEMLISLFENKAIDN